MNAYTVGAAGEIGLFQLHPQGQMPNFYAYGYSDLLDPYQQIAFVAEYVAKNSWEPWIACLP